MFRDEELENLVARKDYEQIRKYVNEKKTELYQEADEGDREKLQTLLGRLQFDIDDVTRGASTSEIAYMEIGKLIGICDTIRRLLQSADKSEADLNLFGEEKDLPADTLAIAEKLYRQGCMTDTELAKQLGTLEEVGMVFMTSAGKFQLLSLTDLGSQYVEEVDKAAKKHFGKVD